VMQSLNHDSYLILSDAQPRQTKSFGPIFQTSLKMVSDVYNGSGILRRGDGPLILRTKRNGRLWKKLTWQLVIANAQISALRVTDCHRLHEFMRNSTILHRTSRNARETRQRAKSYLEEVNGCPSIAFLD